MVEAAHDAALKQRVIRLREIGMEDQGTDVGYRVIDRVVAGEVPIQPVVSSVLVRDDMRRAVDVWDGDRL